MMRGIAAHSGSRQWLNALYERLTLSQREYFYLAFAKAFRDHYGSRIDAGSWKVEFAGRRILLPITPERIWLDWDLALSIVAHDAEVTTTYEALLNSAERPDVFLDIGANYGTHSLLFLMQGVDVITFEPNVECHEYFRECCAMNGVEPRIEGVALGETHTPLNLSFPERDTWLGSTDATVQQQLQSDFKLVVRRVEQKMLDDYLPILGSRRVLIKMDVEGYEHQVLKGAVMTLDSKRARIIFEAHRIKRPELFDFFSAADYKIAYLPWSPNQAIRPINRPDFLRTKASNFLAVPRESSS